MSPVHSWSRRVGSTLALGLLPALLTQLPAHAALPADAGLADASVLADAAVPVGVAGAEVSVPAGSAASGGVAGSGAAAVPPGAGPDAAGVAAAAAGEPGTVIGAGAAGAVPGRYIVTRKPAATTTGPGFGVSTAGPGSASYTAHLSADAARRLAADPEVAYVEQDRPVHLEATQRNPVWGLDRVDQRAARPSHTFAPLDDGNAVHAYVIDTGIRITHAQFGGRASYGYDFVGDDRNATDCAGHGTHVAGTIGGSAYGVAKKVKLVAVRVLNCKGVGYVSDIVDGVNWVTRNAIRPAVANMSLGAGYSPSLEAAVRDSIRSGVPYVVAAGNQDTDAAKGSPSGVPAAITVAASDVHDRRAWFSNFGSTVDMFAPGVDVRSASITSNTATAVLSGTSMASPHVAGAVALVLDAFPAYTAAQARAYLVDRATTGRIVDRMNAPNRLLFVPGPPAPSVITTATLPVARAGTAYQARLTLRSGRRGAWRVAAGTLPAGLTLSPAGLISGTPAGPAARRVTLTFTDYVPQVVSRTFTVLVQP